jgi:beta-lactam-binding protein with PASTA domain
MRRALLAVAIALALTALAGAQAATARKVTVPNVVGLITAKAQARLRAAKLTPHVRHVKSLKLVGTVVGQRPRARTRVAPRTRVTISVSSGPGP